MEEEGDQAATSALNNPSNWVIHEEMTYASGTTSHIETFYIVFVCLITNTPPSSQRICPFISSFSCISLLSLSHPLGHVTLPDLP